MTSFLKSVFKTLPVSASNQPTLSSLNVIVHPLTEFEEMSNLSTTSVVTALEALQKSFLGGSTGVSKLNWDGDEEHFKQSTGTFREMFKGVD